MSTDQPPAIDAVARAMTAAVRTFVGEVMRDLLQMDMQGGEAAMNACAHACMERLPQRCIPALVASHDALAASGRSLQQRRSAISGGAAPSTAGHRPRR